MAGQKGKGKERKVSRLVMLRVEDRPDILGLLSPSPAGFSPDTALLPERSLKEDRRTFINS